MDGGRERGKDRRTDGQTERHIDDWKYCIGGYMD